MLQRRTPLAPRRKRKRMIKPEREVDLAHLARVKSLPCIACGAPPPSCAHHIRTRPDGQTYGAGQRASDLETIPLCRNCHTDGPQAFHNGPRSFRERHGSERDLLAATLAMLGKA